MKRTLALIWHSWRRSRPLVLLVATLLALFQVVMVLAAQTLQTTGTLSQLSGLVPPVIRVILGPALISVMSFAGVTLVGYFHFAVVAALAGLAIALCTELTGEIEIGFADLLLSRPLDRSNLVTRSVVMLLAASALIVLAMWAGTGIGLRFLTPADTAGPSWRLVFTLGANLWALVVCWGSIALLTSTFCRRRAVASATAGLLALFAFLLDYVARFWKPAGSVAWLSPFQYYSGMDLIMGRQLATRHVTILLVVALVAVLGAYAAIRRRDI